ncbi:MAG: hypothetical protein FJX42_08820 [Alphaproteobacteria bacterium]|nr:hypothetical protein [Alphaproteobacteria bacterium]
MKPLTVGFPTFIKLASLSIKPKKSQLKKYLGEGGYDFYWSMKQGASGISLGYKTYETAIAVIGNLAKKAEREHNKFGLQQFMKWFDTDKRTYEAPEEARFISLTKNFEVKIKPEVAFYDQESLTYMCLWNTGKPTLSPLMGGMGVYFIREAFGKPGDKKFAFFDLRRGKIYREEDIPTKASEWLNAETSLVEALWIEVNKDQNKGEGKRVPSKKEDDTSLPK